MEQLSLLFRLAIFLDVHFQHTSHHSHSAKATQRSLVAYDIHPDSYTAPIPHRTPYPSLPAVPPHTMTADLPTINNQTVPWTPLKLATTGAMTKKAKVGLVRKGKNRIGARVGADGADGGGNRR